MCNVIFFSGMSYRRGIESHSDTMEPQAPSEAKPTCSQPVVYPAFIGLGIDGSDYKIQPPPNYNPYRPSIQALDKAGLLASIPLGVDYNPDADMTLGDFREYLEMGHSDSDRVRLMDNVQDTQILSRPVSREDSALMSFNIMRRRYSLP